MCSLKEAYFISKWYIPMRDSLLTKEQRKKMHEDIENLGIDFQSIYIKMLKKFNEELLEKDNK